MSLRSTLFNVYWGLRRVIAPGVKYSQATYEEFLTRYVTSDTAWIDIGCGHSLLPSWRATEEKQLVDRCKVLVGIDYDLPSLKAHPTIRWRVRGDVATLPFKNASFDLVTANMVVEHLDRPEDQFAEISRILKPNGLFLFHTPNAKGYGVVVSRLLPDAVKNRLALLLQGREEHDVFKTHYRANTEQQVTALAGASGFRVAQVNMFVSDAILAMIPPLAALELVWLRLLMTAPFRPFRTNMITVLQKTGE
jgi:ubiquinone/menaquinone biosynthesis C-methylase UbiE